jgi:hypothetical protein
VQFYIQRDLIKYYKIRQLHRVGPVAQRLEQRTHNGLLWFWCYVFSAPYDGSGWGKPRHLGMVGSILGKEMGKEMFDILGNDFGKHIGCN